MKEADFDKLRNQEQTDNYMSARSSVEFIKEMIDGLDLNNPDLAKIKSDGRTPVKRKYLIPTPFDIVWNGRESVAVGNRESRDYLEIQHNYNPGHGEDFYVLARNVDQNENHHETGSILIQLSASNEIYGVESNNLEPMVLELLLEGVKDYYPDIASGKIQVHTS